MVPKFLTWDKGRNALWYKQVNAISRGKQENNGFFRDNWVANVRIRNL